MPGNPFKGEPPLPRFLLIAENPEPPAPSPPPARTELPKPGCVAADDTLLVYGHLYGLASGLGGFGLLRLSKERMEHAAQAAEWVKEPDLAEDMRTFASLLPEVHDEEGAAAALEDMSPLIERVWVLGVRCGRTTAALAKAEVAMREIRKGVHSESSRRE